MSRRENQTLMGRMRQLFLTGVAILLPLIITIWVLRILFRMVHGLSTPLIRNILEMLRTPYADEPIVTTYLAPLIGIVSTLLLVVLVGALTTNLLGRQFVTAFDRLMLRIPLIKGIYGAARQLLDAFNTNTKSFQKVVAVEYPRPGLYTVGFVTRDQVSFRAENGARTLPGLTLVFLPTTPNPTSGWLAAVPDEQVHALDLTVEEGVKLVVSGGLVLPPTWSKR
ncbi:MAG TPA: DUF502 domain-containing protein [Candidatus Polarisedimenticolia bacterium]|nr:DUF502 domain-containing protein [Candidatus Polarisedimenticolia bacterium]